ncbi:transporter [Brumimicrobium glaciale]|uniref:Transporter n=1 Tax=Brumimicrobium glaciale TaxID=200475 RepID=A0A4Q4KS02_9FLAO|nr:TolC family protein [Brumimicrobium glaciale]RYM35712.1 transporter [Brumimicrobium glaciale]
MKKSFYIILLLFGMALNAKSQISIDSVLYTIEQNNKTIQANVQLWEAKKMEYKTGLMPSNPKVDYDFLNGSPVGAGNQIDFAVTQSFDFPTVYSKKKQLSEEQIKQAEFQLTSAKQDILLEAKLTCIELVYRYKFQSEVLKRKESTDKWLSDFQSSMVKGERSILDVNKAKLQLTEINADFQRNLSAINQLNQKLTELNGGVVLNVTDLSYSEIIEVPSFENLEEEIKANDPIREYIEQENVIIEKKIELSKAMSLPKVEAGYRYQAILGQRFNGVHVGLTIPLWENKNKVKAQQANLEFNDLNLLNHSNERYYYIQNIYEKQLNLKLTLDEYETLFTGLNTVELLDKSLELGHISTIEYFMELSFYYGALKNYLMTEKEYRQSIAELFKYKL